ncbi:MAG: carboxypeptidase regulatory-like domain-containing protein [Akkermansiaceae bacterium]|nr:carboxypeptidase regulatory-like domain-containing protein [Akkermansiaceae bacterium]
MFNGIVTAAGILALAGPVLGAEAFQVRPGQAAELPGGKEADGIIGDFVLRSDTVEAVISQDAPERRANMSTFYGSGGITPGCLYDLTLRGADNDQLTILAPLSQRGKVSWVRTIPPEELGENEAGVETVVTAALAKGVHWGLYKRYRYIVKDGLPGVTIVTTLRNEGHNPVTIRLRDKWTGIAHSQAARGFVWADAVDPADKAGYALAWVKSHGAVLPEEIPDSPPPEPEPDEDGADGEGEKAPKSEKGEKDEKDEKDKKEEDRKDLKDIAPGESLTVARFLAVGTSPLEAVAAAAEQTGLSAEGLIVIEDEGGRPIPDARIMVEVEKDKVIRGYPDENGRLRCVLPVGTYPCKVRAPGRATVEVKLELVEEAPHRRTVKMGPQSTVAFDIKDDDGETTPCKVQFKGVDGTASPDLGPANRAHGCVDQWHSETGTFRVGLPSGKYQLTVTRGPEFSHLQFEVEVDAGETVEVDGILRRLVDSTGWVSSDFHNHSSPSGDNTCGTEDRVINLVAEHIEFAPTTEHNRLYDWTPFIEKLGLEEKISTVPGIELTGGGGHLNSFPMKPVPHRQDGGAPVWDPDPRVNALHLREFQGGDPDRWVQLNHPRMEVEFFDRDGDGEEDGGYLLLGEMLDGLETDNFVTEFREGAGILGDGPYWFQKSKDGTTRKVVVNRGFTWLQLLNRGTRVWAVAVADAHSVHGNGVGGWRTYIPSSTDVPGEIDWREISANARRGRMVLTTGPFLEVTAGDGVLPGGELRASGKVDVAVKVQCTDWLDIDRVQVLVNGRQREDLNFTRQSNPGMFGDGVVKFEEVIEVPLEEDSHIIVVAIGEGFDLKTGYGTSRQSGMMPCAYNNPIFVDVDGGGFAANGDTLGYPLPVQGMTVDAVKALHGETEAETKTEAE